MDNTDELTTHQIEYTRTVVPSTMRSPYWKFFGFPSDSSNNVLTKLKIVCSLCNAVIAYNKNTSNLRTHIVARHPELLIELYNEKNKKNIEGASSPACTLRNKSALSEPAAKRPKTLYLLSANETKGNPTQSSYVSPSHETESSDLKPYNDTIIEVNEVEQVDDKTADNSDCDEYCGSIANTYTFEEIEDNTLKMTVPLENNINVEEQLLNMLITDLQPPSIVEDIGFMKFATAVGTPGSLLRKRHVEEQINNLYNKSFKRIHKNLKAITNTMPYSLSTESYQNIEGKMMMCIYFNHVIPAEARLQYTAYTTIEATMTTDYAVIFNDFNLSNCSALIMSEENEALEQFFESHGIPIIPCFESVINNCMMAIFAHTAINNAYKKTLEMFEKHDCGSMLESVPEIFEENPWSKYNFLQFVQDHVSLADEENTEAMDVSKQLVGFLSPLKITLETIADEPLPLCSLMKPLCRKLTEEYFTSYFCETDALNDVKNTVTNELAQRILSNMFLSEASFLDPRFQAATVESENISQIKDSIAQRFEHLLANNIAEEKSIKTEAKTTQRKSSLKLFFNRGAEQDAKPVQNVMKRSLDYEIMKYTAEAVAELDHCPMKWWEENEFVFRKLRKISDYYLCVPCCATSHFKYPLNDRITTINRRFMLRKSIVNQMWFLHFNKDAIDLSNDEPSKK